MTTITKVRKVSYFQTVEVIRQGKAFYAKGHYDIHRFMELLPPPAMQSVEVPQHVWAIMAGPFIQVVPEGRAGAFKVTITYHTTSKKRLYDRVHPKCGNCDQRVCTDICRQRNGVGARR